MHTVHTRTNRTISAATTTIGSDGFVHTKAANGTTMFSIPIRNVDVLDRRGGA